MCDVRDGGGRRPLPGSAGSKMKRYYAAALTRHLPGAAGWEVEAL